MNINKFAIGIFLILASNIVCKAQSDCVYDESRLTDSFLKTSKQIDFYKWDADKKEGTAILNDGSVLNVKKWACNHIGTSANMMITKEQFNADSWKDCINELSRVVCNKEEIKIIETKLLTLSSFESLSEKSCRKEIDLSNIMYPEFYISIYELEDTVLFSIFYYMTP